MKLSAQAIRDYRPPAGKSDHIVFDEDLSGFGLRYRDGRKTWVFQYAFGTGESRVNARMTLGEYPALPPAKARETAQDLYAKVRLGQHPAADKKVSRGEARNTFGRLVRDYLEFKQSELRDASYVEVERYLNRYARALHGLPATAIDRKRIADFLDSIARHSGPVSANRARTSLSALFAWAMRKGLHDSNPVVATETRKEKSRHRVLTDPELSTVWNMLGDGDYADISGWTRCKERLDRRIGDELGKPLPHWTVHDLRRTAATRMVDLGEGPHIVEAVLNHVSGHRVAGIYNRSLYKAEKAQALSKWATHVLAVAKGKKSNVTPIRGRA